MTLTNTQTINYLIGVIESNATVIPLYKSPENYSAGCDAIGMMDLGG